MTQLAVVLLALLLLAQLLPTTPRRRGAGQVEPPRAVQPPVRPRGMPTTGTTQGAGQSPAAGPPRCCHRYPHRGNR